VDQPPGPERCAAENLGGTEEREGPMKGSELTPITIQIDVQMVVGGASASESVFVTSSTFAFSRLPGRNHPLFESARCAFGEILESLCSRHAAEVVSDE